MTTARPSRILLVTGLSGAGKSTALDTLEDLGWETVDNLPLVLLNRLLAAGLPQGSSDVRPLAIGIDSRTRGFDAAEIVTRVEAMRDKGADIDILFLDCATPELERRYSETRRRHPLALDRPAVDGIARERDLLAPIRQRASHVVDTTAFSSNALKLDLRARFGVPEASAPTLTILSFGFARGLPLNADLVFDMRFLHNPHWVPQLRVQTGLDDAVATYVEADPAYPEAIGRIGDLLTMLLPRYAAEGKSYVTVAFGCTGGRHRSVRVTEDMAQRLRRSNFSPTVIHRDLPRPNDDSIDRWRTGRATAGKRGR